MKEPTLPIETARLTLRPFRDDDLSDLHAYGSLPEVARFLYWQARTLDETKEALAAKSRQVDLTEEGSRLCLAVRLKDVPRVIGEVLLIWRSRTHRQGEIGFVFHPAYGRRGYATEAARAILAVGFDDLDLHRMFGRCDARNVASYELMARIGMRREAHFVQSEWFKGVWADEYVYAVLQAEWMEHERVRRRVARP